LIYLTFNQNIVWCGLVVWSNFSFSLSVSDTL
jgi:hypothetical protein